MRCFVERRPDTASPLMPPLGETSSHCLAHLAISTVPENNPQNESVLSPADKRGESQSRSYRAASAYAPIYVNLHKQGLNRCSITHPRQHQLLPHRTGSRSLRFPTCLSIMAASTPLKRGTW